jgi:uncharacterized RDD family membrane protein YckC
LNQLPIQLPDLDFAPKWQRAIHLLVDTALGVVVGALLMRELWPHVPEAWVETLLEWPERRVKLGLRWSGVLAYYLATEVAFKTTPGKWITRAVVRDADGRVPTRKRLLLRALCRFIPLDWLSFFGRDGTGWHDAASKTYVVRRSAMSRDLAM